MAHERERRPETPPPAPDGPRTHAGRVLAREARLWRAREDRNGAEWARMLRAANDWRIGRAYVRALRRSRALNEALESAIVRPRTRDFPGMMAAMLGGHQFGCVGDRSCRCFRAG